MDGGMVGVGIVDLVLLLYIWLWCYGVLWDYAVISVCLGLVLFWALYLFVVIMFVLVWWCLIVICLFVCYFGGCSRCILLVFVVVFGVVTFY